MIDLTKVADADIELVVQWDDEGIAIGAAARPRRHHRRWAILGSCSAEHIRCGA